MECLWCVKFWHLCFKQEDQLIEWMTKGQGMALRINVLQYNRFIFRQQSPFLWEKTRPLCLALVGLMAGRLADKIQLEFWTLKILYRLNYLNFYFVYSSVKLLIVLEVHFSLLFSNKVYFRGCFVVCKIQSPFFSCQSLLLGTSIPNDIAPLYHTQTDCCWWNSISLCT